MKVKNKSLGVNAVLNAFKSALAILFPLITYPYAFRILHTEGIGKVNYATSIISYFILIASLGISTYAVREGAKYRDKPKVFNEFCNQIFSFNILTTMISYVLLFLVIFSNKSLYSYKDLLLILSLTIAFTTFSIEWVNTIFEDFLFITIRSIVIYLITMILLFLIVKNEDDYILYALLTVVNSGCICISNWIYCRKYVHIKFTVKMEISKHIKPVLTFFANAVATSIYVNSDTTMIGYLIGDHFVGLYTLAVKIYNVIKTMLAAMYTVAIPRLSFFAGQGDKDNIKKIYTALLSNLTIILLPAGVGLAAISREIILIMGGKEYLAATLTLQILSLSLIGAIFGGAITYCLNIPLGREKINVKATMISALINIVLNIFLIPMFKQNGAAITTVISEFFVAAYCLKKFENINEYLNIKNWLKNLIQALIGCVIVIVVSVVIKSIFVNTLIRIGAIIILSVFIYTLELLMLKNEIIFSVIIKINNKLV